MRTQSCVAFAASHLTQRYGVTFPLLTSARCYGGSQHTPIILLIHHMRPCAYCCCISAFNKLLNEHRHDRSPFCCQQMWQQQMHHMCFSLIVYHSLLQSGCSA